MPSSLDFQSKPYSAITVQINRLTSEQYEADDMSGIVDLIEVIRLQTGGPTEAARAIRKKLKYGSVDQQLRALTVLDGLIENAGPRFQRGFADEPLLERLRVCATDSMSDLEVKKKCQILFRQWAVAYQSSPGMERVVALQRQLPKRKKPVTQAQSKVLQETEREANEDPFGSTEDDIISADSSSMASPNLTSRGNATSSITPTPKYNPKKMKPDKHSKKSRLRAFNLEKEKPQLLQAIASSSVASTNLMNALKLLNREKLRVSEHAETVNRFDTCKALRRQILRYIQHVESEQWLGSLINANDSLVEALMAYEILDKSVDDDSDSEGQEWSDDERPAKPTRPELDEQKKTQEAFPRLYIRKNPSQQHPMMPLNGQGGIRHAEDDDSEGEEGDDPFADSNAVHTPKAERPGMTW
ncbi:MAG: Putative actin patch assembly and actin polymerization protein [Alectoria sarmentosa]|nr:MAG: Putative actin patch assembly and actin polymerization protein [Alectoria sarmentosa]